VICGLWLLWVLRMVRQEHSVVQDGEMSMLKFSKKWTVKGRDLKTKCNYETISNTTKIKKDKKKTCFKIRQSFRNMSLPSSHSSNSDSKSPFTEQLSASSTYHYICLHKRHTQDYLSAKPEAKTGKTHLTAIHLAKKLSIKYHNESL